MSSTVTTFTVFCIFLFLPELYRNLRKWCAVVENLFSSFCISFSQFLSLKFHFSRVILLSCLEICFIWPGINFLKMSKSLVTMKLSRPRVPNKSKKKKKGISLVSIQEWPPVYPWFSCWVSIRSYEGILVSFLLILFKNFFFLSVGKIPTKLSDRFQPLFMKNFSSSALETLNPVVSIISLIRLCLFLCLRALLPSLIVETA